MKLLHTADIHLGTRTYGRIDPETGLNSRLLDFQRSFRFMVERALAEDIDLFLFCGDAYRNADPDPTEQRIFAECLKPVADRGIPIVMIVGNHDHPVSFGKASAIDIFGYLSGNVTVFRKPDHLVIETKSGPVHVIALPWPIRSAILSREEHRGKSATEIRDYLEQVYIDFVADVARHADPSIPTVLAAHLTVQGAELSGSERTSTIALEPVFSAARLGIPPIDYVALGHIHRFQDRNEGGSPPVVYSSSIERINFKEWDDPKGFVLVDISMRNGKKETTYSFVETPARPLVPIRVDARQAADPTEHILEALARQPLSDAIVRVEYHIDEAQIALVDVQRIREALKEARFIASIERTIDPVERQRRTVVNRETSLEEAMRHYVAQHEHLTPLADELVRRALELETEYESRRGRNE